MKNLNALSPLDNENGKAGYLLAWLLGVPAGLLFVIYLIFH
jgi:hypothetical protein